MIKSKNLELGKFYQGPLKYVFVVNDLMKIIYDCYKYQWKVTNVFLKSLIIKNGKEQIIIVDNLESIIHNLDD